MKIYSDKKLYFMIQKKMQCPLTGREVTRIEGDTVSYDLTIAGNTVEIFLCRGCGDNIRKLNLPHHIISGLIANKIFPERAFVRLKKCNNIHPPIDSESVVLPEFIETAVYPKTPKEKMEHFFLDLFKRQNIDGEVQELNFTGEDIWIKNYFKNQNECEFYFEGLKENGWIKQIDKYTFQVTHFGLNVAVELQSEGSNSNKCFIAMAFNTETKEYREAIKRALNKTEFKPIIIDEEHLASDKTIPDGILAGIKQSKFCIADFTYNIAGVYFESGFALGLGKPVIYLCREKEFPGVHFDVKQLQHIIYKDAAELEKRLIEKIDAWIK